MFIFFLISFVRCPLPSMMGSSCWLCGVSPFLFSVFTSGHSVLFHRCNKSSLDFLQMSGPWGNLETFKFSLDSSGTILNHCHNRLSLSVFFKTSCRDHDFLLLCQETSLVLFRTEPPIKCENYPRECGIPKKRGL